MYLELKEFLCFEWMISPILIQIFFGIGLITCLIIGVWTMISASFLQGLWVLIIGPIILRVSCEAAILIFRINKNIETIKHNTTKSG